MGQAASIRGTIRALLTSLGKTCNLYSFSGATVTTNEEGENTAITWGTATEFKGVSSNNFRYKRLMEAMGLETNNSERVLIVRDDLSVSAKDKITIGTDIYEVVEIKNLDPIEDDIIIAKRLTLAKNELYT